MKVKSLLAFAQRYDIIFLQELHGTYLEIMQTLGPLNAEFHILASPHESRNSGGVATLVSHRMVPVGRADCIFEIKEIEGRALFHLIGNADTQRNLVLCNLHHYGLEQEEAKALVVELEGIVDSVIEDPWNSQLILGGDLNMPPNAEAAAHISDPEKVILSPEPWNPAGTDHILLPLLNKLTEVVVDGPTHFDAPTGKLQRLDRWFTCMPSWLMLQQQLSGQLESSLRKLMLEASVTMLPLVFSISRRRLKPPGNRIIPKWIAGDPAFGKHCICLHGASKLKWSLPASRLAGTKDLMKEAAELVEK